MSSSRSIHRGPARDSGSVLPLVLVLIVIAGLFIVPLLSYATGVLANNGFVESQNSRGEAVEGALRIALQDATKLYEECSKYGPTQAGDSGLAAPPAAPGLPSLEVECSTIEAASTNKPGEQRWAITTTQVGSGANVPAPEPDDPSHPELAGTIGAMWCTSKLADPPVPCGKAYAKNGDPVTTTWQGDVATESTNQKVFLPFLPSPDRDLQPAGGFVMPNWNPDGPCNVYFPGRYTDEIVLDGPAPVYFVSGIYYFEKAVKVKAGAVVVAGTGSVPGCVDSDSTAALNAIDQATGLQPRVDQVNGASGVGATFVFGAQGRLVVDNTGTGTINFVMNRRVEHSEKPEVVMNDVSIVSVNGVTTGSVTTALDIPNQINVPASVVFGSAAEPATHEYTSSTLISPLAAPTSCATGTVTAACPIIDIALSTANDVYLDVPGYVAVPQGSVLLNSTPTAASGSYLSFNGGILAGQISVPGTVPDSLQFGIVETIVQRTFMVVARTTAGRPTVTGTMIVQVNESGGYDINSYTVQRT